jgi:hypothetical protein
MTKTESNFLFSSTKIRIFFQQHRNTDVLSTSLSFIRDGPFNFQEGEEGGYGFFSKKIF